MVARALGGGGSGLLPHKLVISPPCSLANYPSRRGLDRPAAAAHAVLRPPEAARLRIARRPPPASATGCTASARINSAAGSSLARTSRVQPGDAASSRTPYARPDAYANVRTKLSPPSRGGQFLD